MGWQLRPGNWAATDREFFGSRAWDARPNVRGAAGGPAARRSGKMQPAISWCTATTASGRFLKLENLAIKRRIPRHLGVQYATAPAGGGRQASAASAATGQRDAPPISTAWAGWPGAGQGTALQDVRKVALDLVQGSLCRTPPRPPVRLPPMAPGSWSLRFLPLRATQTSPRRSAR